MLVEQELCRKLVEIFRAALPNVEVEGNWLPSEDGGFKGEPDVEGSVLKVRVSQRGYTSYTNKVAEFKVEIDGTIRVEEDTDGSETFVCCERIINVLSGWQNDICQVKSDLTIQEVFDSRHLALFDPVGYQMNPDGDLDIEDKTLTRKYNQSFTIKGRIIR